MFLLAPSDTYGLSRTVFELFSWHQKRFRPPIRAGYYDKYRSIGYRFVERKKIEMEQFY